MSKQNYDELKAAIEAIAADQAIEPQMPVAIALQEAEDLKTWCTTDREVLTKVGLDWAVVDSLGKRIGACRYIQSEWQQEYNTQEESQRRWTMESPKAFDLRDELVHHCYHAFHNIPDLYSKVQKIAEGSGNADMIQDLSDLSVLGKANRAPLEKVGVNMQLFDLAATTADAMGLLLSQANGSRLSGNALKVNRDKAYTYLKQAVDEIRRNGQYAFYRNEERKKGYVSRYLQKKNNRKTTETK